MKKTILIVLVIAALGAAGLLAYRSMHPEVTDRIVVSGNIELTQVDIAFKTAGRLVERTVNEGDPVQKGMVIARLDREQLLRQRDTAEAALQTAEAQLAESESALKWQRETMQADLQLRNADLSAAESQLLQLKNGARPQERQQAAAAVSAAQAQYDQAKKDWDRAQKLYKDDDISTSMYDQSRTRFESSEATLRQAKEQADLVTAGPRSETIESASAQVRRAQASLRVGQANSIETKRREQDLVARRGDIERAKSQIALIDTQLADTIAISPINGVVLVKAADPGEILAPGSSVVTVGDIEHPWLRAYIREQDLGRVKLGAKAKVTTDSYPGKSYDGRISFISSEAEFTPKQIQTAEERVKLVYRVKIEIDNARHELKSNMPADAEILTGELMEGIIRTRELTRRFDTLTAVDHLNLEIPRGEIFGLVGPDGAGKTTTLRMLCGLLDPSEGEAWVAGHDVVHDTNAVKDSIGYMAQRFGLYVDLTVDENMEFYADLFGIPIAERQRLLPELLRMTRMEPFRNRQAGKLSGGMKQKLGLMCTLLHRPEILFLDEPSNGVDPVSRRDFWAILYQLVKDGITVLVTTAYLDEAERCNRVGLMYRGRLIQCNAPDAARYEIAEECYQVEAPEARTVREILLKADGVLCAEPSGATLHLFLNAAQTSPDALRQKLDKEGHGPAVFQRIVPSLEDVFIAQVRKAERQ